MYGLCCHRHKPARAGEQGRAVIVDCNDCAVRGPACGDCVVTVLLGPLSTEDKTVVPFRPLRRVEFDQAETQALSALGDAGLVPHLRLVPREKTQLRTG
ncbi:hypothetical protein [Smaragdicoccus niigatensis]|uniref:hypothetical protein n=1 Tax=Smaragdicoccus niigatensis TaxID=359359 RepID=UPI0009DBE6B9|nr:hypothetical protein [Smaragdicoccus niigatensis]